MGLDMARNGSTVMFFSMSLIVLHNVSLKYNIKRIIQRTFSTATQVSQMLLHKHQGMNGIWLQTCTSQ
jgi:hypothetical protein